MAKYPMYPNKTGINAALDLVEETLAKLKEREEQTSRLILHKNTETCTTGVQTSATNLCLDNADTQKETSVLISRRSSRLSNSSKGQHHHRSVTGKTKIKKKKSVLLERCGPKHPRESNHFSRASDAIGGSNDSRDVGMFHYGPQHSRRSFQQRKRSSSSDDSNYEYLGKRNIQGMSSHSKNSAGEFLRGHDDSRDEVLGNGQSRLWVPPLSQSSPRELTRSRANSKNSQHTVNSQHTINSQHTLNVLQETSVPSSSKSRVGFSRNKNSNMTQPPKTTIPMSGQSYAEPTLTSKLRVKLSERKEKEEKENMIPFIPSGSTNISHHVGVIIQQKLGLLKNIPSKKLESLTGPFNAAEIRNNDGTDSESLVPTEEVIKTAMNNLQEHIAQVTKHSSKREHYM